MSARHASTGAANDEGVYAILYAILVVVLLACCAIVVDTALVRQDRRLDRSASDSAAIAGAAYVNPAKASASPTLACQKAWQYLSNTLKISTPGSACSAFSGYTLATCPGTEVDDDRTVGDLTIRVAWPVPSTSGFMTPDIAPGSVSQPFSAGTDDNGRGDGTAGGCERLGVAVFQTAKFRVAAAFGATGVQTQVHSVARYVFLPGNDEYNYPLVVLDPHACSALNTNGTGANILVQNGATASPSNPNLPGRIAVDSDGVGCNQFILTVNGSSGFIQAEDGADAGTNPADENAIEIYSPGATAPGNSYTGVSMPCTPTTSPSPTNTPCVGRVVHRIERVTRAPFDQKFKPRVDQLAASFGTVQTTKSGGVWSITSNSTGLTWYLITGNACNQNFTGTAALGTNYFVNCPAEGNWSLSNTWSFQPGANVIVNGDLTLKNAACFSVNVSAACVPVPDASLTANSILSIRGNVNASGSGALFVIPGTFLSMVGVTGNLNPSVDASGFGVVYWTAPYGDKTTLENACKAAPSTGAPPVACFRNLAFWTESSTLDVVQGGTSLTLAGTFFLGLAPLKVGGNGTVTVTQSQFVALTVTTSGTKPLTFTPDPNRTTGVPRSGVTLIR